MAARGTKAKENIIKKLEKVFGEDFIGEIDKKVYLWADDGGEKVQIAINMTCPKTNVDAPAPKTAEPHDWSCSDTLSVKSAPAQITEEEKNNIAKLMASLGL